MKGILLSKHITFHTVVEKSDLPLPTKNFNFNFQCLCTEMYILARWDFTKRT